MEMVKDNEKVQLGESQAARFTRLAQARTTNVLRSIRILSNLSNRSNYEYTPEQVSKIFRAIRDQLDIAERKFEAGAHKTVNEEFVFDQPPDTRRRR